jgi:hypothetical protein
MRKFYGVENHNDLLRDADSKAILNNDTSSLNKYKEERDFKIKLASIVDEHQIMKEDMKEIKYMLNKLLGSINK